MVKGVVKCCAWMWSAELMRFFGANCSIFRKALIELIILMSIRCSYAPSDSKKVLLKMALFSALKNRPDWYFTQIGLKIKTKSPAVYSPVLVIFEGVPISIKSLQLSTRRKCLQHPGGANFCQTVCNCPSPRPASRDAVRLFCVF